MKEDGTMQNWIHGPGVYCNMHRLPLFLICALVAVAQPAPQQDPLDVAIQRVWQARNNGHFEEAAAARVSKALPYYSVCQSIHRASPAGRSR